MTNRLRRRRWRAPTTIAAVAGMFLAGAGIGAGLVAVIHSGHGRPRKVVETVVTDAAPVTARHAPSPARTRGMNVHGADGSGSFVPNGARSSFAALAARLPGEVGVAIAPLGAGAIRTWGHPQVARAWSTSKVPVLVALLRDDEASGRPLDADAATDATLALEESDNAAIEALFVKLEDIHGGLVAASGAVQQALRRAGDETTSINTVPNDQGFTTYGQTEWSLSGEVTFYRALARGCLLDAADTAYVLDLMRSVTASQRWGVGSAGYPSSTAVAFKGGWGPDSEGRYQVRQTAIIGSGNRGYVVSMLALPANGSFAEGTSMLTALAGWVMRQFNPDATRPAAGCAATGRSPPRQVSKRGRALGGSARSG